MVAIDIESALRSRFAEHSETLATKGVAHTNSPQAAVAIIFAEADWKLLFIKRADHQNDPWSGHVALPGGRLDPTDLDLEVTARRETLEEVGLELRDEYLWGPLSPVQARSRSSTPMWVMPYVYRVSGKCPPLTLNYEVQAARWIPVTQLLEPRAQSNVVFDTHPGKLQLPAWSVDDFTIWGLTYFIVRSLIEPLFSFEFSLAGKSKEQS